MGTWSMTFRQNTNVTVITPGGATNPGYNARTLGAEVHLAGVIGDDASGRDLAGMLSEAGVDVNCRPGANTPLVAAIDARNAALMTYLEEHGAREKP